MTTIQQNFCVCGHIKFFYSIYFRFSYSLRLGGVYTLLIIARRNSEKKTFFLDLLLYDFSQIYDTIIHFVVFVRKKKAKIKLTSDRIIKILHICFVLNWNNKCRLLLDGKFNKVSNFSYICYTLYMHRCDKCL